MIFPCPLESHSPFIVAAFFVPPRQSKYGTDWRNHLPQSLGVTSIKELIDHVIDEGNRLFADTRYKNSWVIYHDALPQWWEATAQAHIASRGFAERQWRARGETNAAVHRRFKDKLMGDSPELMPLDSSLFGDQIEKVAWLVMMTAALEKEKRFSMGTPDEAWRTMVAAWDLVPEARIAEDIERFVTALEAIIAAKGAYVEDMDLRNGHRKVMQRLVRGGAVREDGGNRAATEALIEEGLAGVMKTWEGISAKLGG